MSDYVQGLVSIIITTCKREMAVLERALKSAEAQTYKNREILIVNDYPAYRDAIAEMLLKHPAVRLISNDRQSGACISRNKGIAAARGEYIALLDDDDIWKPEKTERQLQLMNEGTGLVYCDYEAHMGSEILKSDASRTYPEGKVLKELLASNFIGGCSIPVMRHEMLVRCGGFDPSFRSCQDLDVWIRMAKAGCVKGVRDKLSIYTVGNDSITGSFERRLQGWKHILKKYSSDFKKYPESRRKFTGTIVREAAKRETFGEAFKLAVKYCRIYDMINGLAQKILRIY